MKDFFLALTLVLGGLGSLNAQQVNSVRIGSQTWMATNANKEIPGSSYYNDDVKNAPRYGKLYTYEAAKNVCPAGWRLPTVKDWDELLTNLGGEDKAASMLIKPTNDGGFNAKLAGIGTVGNYKLLDSYGAYWTSTANDKENAWFVYFTSKSNSVTTTFSVKSHQLSVRCIKN